MASMQSLENWLYMSTFLAAKAVPMVAVGSSLVFAVSPLQTVRSIQRAGSTMQFPFAPFFFFFIQSVIYTLYGYTMDNVLMGGSAALSAVLGLHYVYVYCKHAADRAKPVRYVVSSLAAITLLGVHTINKTQAESQLLIGIPGNVLSLMTSASPLLQVKHIVQSRDASCLPFGMSVMTVVAGGVWMVYGMMLRDPLVIYPNMFSLTMGLIQVALILKYSRSSKAVSMTTSLPSGSISVIRKKSMHEKV